MHVPNLVWIIVEDSVKKTELVTNFLNKRKHVLKSVHLNIRTEMSRRFVQSTLSSMGGGGGRGGARKRERERVCVQ